MSRSIVNTLIKLLAFLMAVMLWFYVISRKSYDYELTLPVTEVNLPAGLGAVSGIPDSLTVKIFAEGQKLLSNSWKKAGLRLEASRLHRGINSLELNLESVSLMRSEEIELLDLPGRATAQIHLDRLDSTFKPIASRLAVVPAEDHAVVSGSEKIEPSRTKVTGPAYILGRIDSIRTEQKIIDRAKKAVEVSLNLDIPDSLALSVDTDSILISVQVDKIDSRKFENIPVDIRKSSARKQVIIDPDKISVEIDGPRCIIDSLDVSQLEVLVKPSPSAEDEYLVPEIKLPPDIRLKRIIPDSVRVLVKN